MLALGNKEHARSPSGEERGRSGKKGRGNANTLSFEQELANQCREADTKKVSLVGHPDLVRLLFAVVKKAAKPQALPSDIQQSRLLLV